MGKTVFFAGLMACGICASMFAQTSARTKPSVDRRGGVERLSALLPDAPGACIVAFKTDVWEGQRVGDSAKVKISHTRRSPDDEKIVLRGEFTLAKEIFGQENCPKFGRVELEADDRETTVRPSPLLRRIGVILEPDPEKAGLFLVVSSTKNPDALGQCTFIGPLEPGETDAVVECVKFMKQHPAIDEPTRQTLLSSTNPWMKELAASLAPATAPASTAPSTTTRSSP
jgi:hypothetical protein